MNLANRRLIPLVELNTITFIQSLAIFLLILLLLESSFAGEIKFIPSIGVTENYSDNVTLAPKGQEKSDFVTELSPGFTLQMDGKRFDANVNYTLQDLRYSKDSSRNQTYSQFSANSSAELAEDFLFFDANANHTQQVVNADQPIGFNNIAVTTNLTNVTSYSFSPYFKHSFSNTVEALVRFTQSSVDYRLDQLPDSTQTGTQIQLNSPARTTGFRWALNFSQLKNNYKSISDTEYKQGNIELGYRFTPRSSIFAKSGKEENTFAVNNNQNINDSFWSVGVDWQPGSKDAVSIEYGSRYFGSTKKFRWRHNASRLVLDLNYDEELSNFALTLLQAQQTQNSTGQQNTSLLNNGSISTQTFVRKRGTLGITYNFSKISVLLNYSDEKRDFQNSGNTDELTSSNLLVSLKSSPVLTYVLGTRWNRNYSSNTNFKTFSTYLNFAIQRRLSPSMQAELSINYNLRHSSIALTDYTENLISLGVTKTFN